jgi:Fe(3+) dicitrate transport protein
MEMNKRLLAILIISLSAHIYTQAQDSAEDTTGKEHRYLPEITVVGLGSKSDIQQLPEIVGTSIYAGKKNALIIMDNVKGNVVTQTMRQVMAKIPGIHVWESDGSGVQIGIASRGLSPNRSWEFNVRQNGYDISADPFGYPEAYYNPQLQAVQRVEVIRGHGSLQYGPQFGGLVNYIIRNGSEINKPFQVEMQQTAGSNGLINTYNAVGGETKKFHFYAFFDRRSADGWRENSRFFTNSGFGTFTWRLNDKLSLTAEIMKNHVRSRQPGGHTDANFDLNARASNRKRNWMDIEWMTTALIANYRINEDHKLNVKVFGIAGDRNSVGYMRAQPIKDSIVTATGQYNNRTVDIDQYRNWGAEARYLGDYNLLGGRQTFSGGLRYFKGNTYRYRDGVGTTGIEYDLTRLNPVWNRDIDYRTHNVAAFAENIFRISDKFIVIPGIRYEFITAEAKGINGYNNGNPVFLQNQERDRSMLLAGVGAEYHITELTEFYANITQAFRPMQFADLTAPPTTNEIDPDLKDAKGYNADLGYRGRVGSYLYFDISAFLLQYNNRIGTISQQRQDGSFYNLTTNVGNSLSKGFEGLVEFNPVKAFAPESKWGDVSVFASYGYTDARFGELQVVQQVGNDLVKTNLEDKYVENAPLNILRSGFTYNFKGFSFTSQLSYVDRAFTDANNTASPTANGQNGVIPSYTVIDISSVYTFNKHVNVRAGLNNITNQMYFTRRAGGYPGPGLLPADGRNFFVSLGLTF